MPQVNQLARELVFKVVYYGPGLGGKTTSLQLVHATTRPEHRGKMVSLATPVDRTLYFDFLPIRVPTSRNMTIRLQLFTVPGQVYYNATRKLVLTGADGVVFVADSQVERADANDESFRNLEENLQEHGRSLDEMPHVFAYNKRDMDEICSIEEMERQLNLRGAPSFATVATTGDGVYEALEAITRAVLEDFDQRVPEHRGLAPSPLMLPEGGLAEALRRIDAPSELPNAPIALVAQSPGTLAAREEAFVFDLSNMSPDDSGEQAARVAVEAGTSPGLGAVIPRVLAPTSGIEDLGTAPAEPDGARLSALVRPRSTQVDEEFSFSSSAPPESMEASAQSHFRPLPVPLDGLGMRSSPPEPAPARQNDVAPAGSRAPGATGTLPTAREKSTGQFGEIGSDPSGFSLRAHWPDEEQSVVRRVEEAIVVGDTRDALLLCEVLIERCLEALSASLGRESVDALASVALLGLPGYSYFDYQRLLMRARGSVEPLSPVEAGRAILFATNVCIAVRQAIQETK